eukprot:scaffold137886_cov37-Tisochrysis_lutea.AAC.3
MDEQMCGEWAVAFRLCLSGHIAEVLQSIGATCVSPAAPWAASWLRCARSLCTMKPARSIAGSARRTKPEVVGCWLHAAVDSARNSP